MKKKINLQLVRIAILAVVATVIGITTVYYGMFQRQVRNDLKISANLLKDIHYFESEDIQTDDIDITTDMKEFRVTWIGADGTVLYDNDASGLSNHKDRPEIQEAFSEGEGESVRRSDTMQKNTFYYAVLLENGTVLRVSTNAESFWAVLVSSAPLILSILLVILVVCIVISHMLTGQLIKPIEHMAEHMEEPILETPYKELVPFANTIRKQHADVLSAAKARQDFTANVSHELKTPLTAISGYAELMESGMTDANQNAHFAIEIRKNADRLLSVINDIIRLSELDRSGSEPAFELLDLNELVRECIDALQVSAGKGNIALHYEGQSCQVRGNMDMLRELVENLTQNAIRYNNDGGSVWIQVIASEEPVLIVKDNGIGIPAVEQSRVFERFYRVDKSRSKATGGTGLGLAIVKHIVEIHNAKLTLDSAPNVGTTIRIQF